DHGRKQRERHHRDEQVQRDLAAGLAERRGEEDGAGQADRHQRVPGTRGRVQVQQAHHAHLTGGAAVADRAYAPCQPPAPSRRAGPRQAGRPQDRAGRARATGPGGRGVRLAAPSCGPDDDPRGHVPEPGASAHSAVGANRNVTRYPTHAVRLDQVCAGAVVLARAAITEVDADQVGAHIEAVPEAERVVTHLFECLMPGYRGWRWAVTVTRAPRSRQATVSETVLLPGPDALLAPSWVPWQERLQPGDVGVDRKSGV